MTIANLRNPNPSLLCLCPSLDVECTCYFAVKSVDDFLVLQQVSDPHGSTAIARL